MLQRSLRDVYCVIWELDKGYAAEILGFGVWEVDKDMLLKFWDVVYGK